MKRLDTNEPGFSFLISQLPGKIYLTASACKVLDAVSHKESRYRPSLL